VALGDRLFHDPRLSYENTHSCNSCHDISTNGATAPGSMPGGGALNIPTVFNAALNFRLNWEGDVRTLEGQVEQALGKPQMMGVEHGGGVANTTGRPGCRSSVSRGLWPRAG